jgi:hypothetical protein
MGGAGSGEGGDGLRAAAGPRRGAAAGAGVPGLSLDAVELASGRRAQVDCCRLAVVADVVFVVVVVVVVDVDVDVDVNVDGDVNGDVVD